MKDANRHRIVLIASVVGMLVLVALVFFQIIDIAPAIICGGLIAYFGIYKEQVARAHPKTDYQTINDVLSVECNPYEFAKAYHDLLPTFQTPADKNTCYINIALGLFLQGDYATMLTYLNSFDENQSASPTLRLFYDIWTRYYVLTGAFDKLALLDAKLRVLKTEGFHQSLKESVERTLNDIACFEAMHKGDFDTCHEIMLRRDHWANSNKSGVSCYQVVEHHYLHALVDEAEGKIRDMQRNCIYVIENGKLLHYVQLADEMLKRHAQIDLSTEV